MRQWRWSPKRIIKKSNMFFIETSGKQKLVEKNTIMKLTTFISRNIGIIEMGNDTTQEITR